MSTRKFTVPAVGAAIVMFAASAFAAQHPVSSSALPAALRPALYQALANDAGPAYAIGKDGCATLPKQSLTACFDKDGAHFSGADAPALALHLASYGRGDELMPVKPVAPTIQANRAAYEHGDATEWWRVLPMGFEQGFTVEKRPAGQGELTLALVASRNASSHGGDLAWGKLSYGKLVVTDAKGKVIPATLTNKGDRILIAVNDAHAVYPLTIDPLVWIEQKVTASDGATGDQFGYSVAVSGATAMIGAYYAAGSGNSNQGAVYVFAKSNGTWNQVQKLVASDATNRDFGFGSSVALDGDTALIGAQDAKVNGNGEEGAVYVFTNSGGTWTQTQKLLGSSSNEINDFGASVAVSGSTALIGAPATIDDGPGAAYVFTETGGTWSQQQELDPLDDKTADRAGQAVALDGTFAFVGAPVRGGTNNLPGLVYVYAYVNGTWEPWTALSAAPNQPSNWFGRAISPVGDTLLIGAPEADNSTGAVYEFTLSGGSWIHTQKFTANGGETDRFGFSIARDGETAFIGAVGENDFQGAAYVFSDSGGSWSQVQKLSPGGDADDYGFAVALDGTEALIGAAATENNTGPGSAYFYGQSDLSLDVSAPANVGYGDNYVSQAIATNASTAATPAVAVTVAVPAAASFISANATQGNCSEDSGTVTCSFGQIAGGGGTATANVTLKATGNVGDTIENVAGISKATPPLTASAPTLITQSNCPDGYTEYDGTLNLGQRASAPPYQAPAGEENAILTAPTGFQLYVLFQNAQVHKLYRIPGNEIHRQSPAGTYTWAVQAGSSGGAYMLCLKHP
ncbi:MAG: hypothetical protein ACRES7_07335 [Gammaproteobacteria bacterium]